MSDDLIPTVFWLVGMLIGLGYTLGAVFAARRGLSRAADDEALVAQGRRNVRSEVLRVVTLVSFAVCGVVVLYRQVADPTGDVFELWYRWTTSMLLLVGGMLVVANSFLDSRHREHMDELAIKRRTTLVTQALDDLDDTAHDTNTRVRSVQEHIGADG